MSLFDDPTDPSPFEAALEAAEEATEIAERAAARAAATATRLATHETATAAALKDLRQTTRDLLARIEALETATCSND